MIVGKAMRGVKGAFRKDLEQEAALAVWLAEQRAYEHPKSRDAYVKMRARGAVLDARRRQARHFVAAIDAPEVAAPEPSIDRQALAAKILANAPPEDRELLEVFMAGTHRQLAKRLGISQSTVRRLAAKAIERARCL
jgi:RNA polymerase sigma factor (sigma-70 family)